MCPSVYVFLSLCQCARLRLPICPFTCTYLPSKFYVIEDYHSVESFPVSSWCCALGDNAGKGVTKFLQCIAYFKRAMYDTSPGDRLINYMSLYSSRLRRSVENSLSYMTSVLL